MPPCRRLDQGNNLGPRGYLEDARDGVLALASLRPPGTGAGCPHRETVAQDPNVMSKKGLPLSTRETGAVPSDVQESAPHPLRAA